MGCDVLRLNLLKVLKNGKNCAKILKAFWLVQIENWYFATRYLLILKKKTLIILISKILGKNRKSVLLNFFLNIEKYLAAKYQFSILKCKKAFTILAHFSFSK